MGLSPFCKDWRDRLGGEEPPPVRILEVVNKNDPSGGVFRLLVEREEVRGECSASIKLSYVSLGESFGGFNNHPFCGKWERFPDGQEKISVTGGAVMLTGVPRGAHIGTYLFDEVVRWAKQWPNAEVRRISLSEVDGDDENRERRNAFYEQFGIEFDYSEGKRAGISRPMKAGDLTPVDPQVWQQDIVEYGLVDFLRRSCADIEKKALEISLSKRAVEEHWGELERARRSPVIWACRQFFANYQFWFAALAFFGLLGLSAWREFSGG